MKPIAKFRRALIAMLLAAIVLLILYAYLQPDFILDLANRYVFC
ncbi:hypothetical protein [Undibacterium macrobrachii]|jgi:hypothetical protein|nr:hypothetical protein [Undibacterium macrobrachii]